MPVSLKALAHVRSMNGGGSKAQLLQASDGHLYVTKLVGNPQGTRILANEYVTGRLAELLNVPCPRVTTIEVDQTMTEALGKTCGANFVSGRQHAMSYLGSDTVQVFPSNLDLMTKSINVSKWPNAIILDTLVQNEDLGDRHILMTIVQSSGTTNFWHIDHGHTLGVTRGWPSLNPQSIRARYLYPALVKGGEPFKDAFDHLEALSKETIENTLQDCPLQPWGVADSERSSLVEYLVTARSKVREAIIASKANFSNWV